MMYYHPKSCTNRLGWFLTKKERHAIYHGIKTIPESLILQVKEWIALRQTKGYNIECGVSR
jgi:hypothetical protein